MTRGGDRALLFCWIYLLPTEKRLFYLRADQLLSHLRKFMGEFINAIKTGKIVKCQYPGEFDLVD